jgi:hypothetical protein
MLEGVATLPERPAFRIMPADDGAEVPEGWPLGLQDAVASIDTPEGAALVIGPEVTGSECLLPGTPVVIEVPAAGVRGDFLWPDIVPVRRPRRRNLTSHLRSLRTSAAEGERRDDDQAVATSPAMPASPASPAMERGQPTMPPAMAANDSEPDPDQDAMRPLRATPEPAPAGWRPRQPAAPPPTPMPPVAAPDRKSVV